MPKRKPAQAKRWVQKVKTVSTFPPEGTFKKDAKAIARVLGSKKVSPKGIGSGIRMIQYFINRGGKDLSAARKQELEKAKKNTARSIAQSQEFGAALGCTGIGSCELALSP